MHVAESLNAVPAAAVPATAVGHTMRAIVHPRFGEPDVLAYQEIARPVPGADEVLVRVHAAGASIGDHHIVTGKPYVIRLSPYVGLRGPKHRVPGAALAGRVEAVGANVTTLRVGDEVFGEAPAGAFAEYVTVPAGKLAPRPKNQSFEESAATPWAVTALQALRAGKLVPGQRVLVHGASGGVGTWAVQIAKAMGAHVTAVCSTRNLELVRSLGADQVIDYSTTDFAAGGARFDLIFDTVGSRPLAAYRRALTPTGVFITCSGGSSSLRWLARMAHMAAASLFTRQKLISFIVAPRREDLLALTELVEAGKVRPSIERVYPLADVADALRHVGAGHTRGQVVVRIAG